MRAKDGAKEGHIYISLFFFARGEGDDNLIDWFKMNRVCLTKERLPYADPDALKTGTGKKSETREEQQAGS